MGERRECVVIEQGSLLVAVPVERVVMLLTDDQVDLVGTVSALPALGTARREDGGEGPAFDLAAWLGGIGVAAGRPQWVHLRDGGLWRTGRIIDIERFDVAAGVRIPARIPLLALVRRHQPIYLVDPGVGTRHVVNAGSAA